MFAKQFYWYKLSQAFQLSLCLLLGTYWLAGSKLPDGGRESYHFGGGQNLGPGPCHGINPGSLTVGSQRVIHYWVTLLSLSQSFAHHHPLWITATNSIALWGLPWWPHKDPHAMQETTCYVGDTGLMPGSGRCPGEGNGNPFQHSCLENSMDRGAWRATVHGLARLSD